MYSRCLGGWYTDLGTQTFVPQKTLKVLFFQLYFNKIWVEIIINDIASSPLPASPPFVKGEDMLVGETYSEQNGGIQCFVVIQWGELVEAGQFCFNELQK